MKAKIYQPAKSATQSAKNEFWLLEFNSQDKPVIDEKMLWTSSSNTQDKVKIKFSDKDKAIKFANNLINGKGRMLVRKSGTESKIRIMCESENKILLSKCINIIKKSIK